MSASTSSLNDTAVAPTLSHLTDSDLGVNFFHRDPGPTPSPQASLLPLSFHLNQTRENLKVKREEEEEILFSQPVRKRWYIDLTISDEDESDSEVIDLT